MEKMLRIPLAIMVTVLCVFLIARGANAKSCPTTLTSADCGCVADKPNTMYTLGEDMVCSTRHGIIIGAEGVTIDGAGHKLSGAGTPIGERHCELNVYPELEEDNDSSRIWCVGHPCRQADVQPHDNDPKTHDGCLDSGILNADPTTCQGGFSNVTIKNLEITGWCDGIFVSGTGTEGEETRLTGLLIEGNIIHDNGNPDCGTYTPCPGGDGGDWTHRYYNDAIFTAEIGIDAPGADADVACREYTVGGNEYPDLVASSTGGCEPLPSKRNIIRHNRIYNQMGCGTISCPGGNGINLQGGLELDHPIWSGCNEIVDNYIQHCAMSGIQYTHASTHNRIHRNYVVGNGFGGITDPCGWCDGNYIYDNVAKDNYGCGIGINAVVRILHNYCIGTKAVQNPEYTKLGYESAAKGVGILVGECSGDHYGNGIVVGDNECSEILGNTAVGSAYKDILSASSATGDENMCKTTNNYNDSSASGCRYMAGDRLDCEADLDHDCKVSSKDFDIFSGQWDWGADLNKPACFSAK